MDIDIRAIRAYIGLIAGTLGAVAAILGLLSGVTSSAVFGVIGAVAGFAVYRYDTRRAGR